VCTQEFQVVLKPGPKLGFRVLEAKSVSGGKIFVFIMCLKEIFLVTTKFGEAQKYLVAIVPEFPPRVRACLET